MFLKSTVLTADSRGTMRARWLFPFVILSACVRTTAQRFEPPAMPDVSQQTAAACDLITRLVESTRGADITRTQGTFDDPLAAAVTGHEPEHVFVGCRVLITGSFTALADQQGKGPSAPWVAPPSPDEVLRQALPAEGWTHEFDWDADGPDGTDAVFRRGSTVCMVVGRWQGGLPPAYAEAQAGEDNDLPPLWDPYSVNVGCIDWAGSLRADDSDAAE
jgi:hypothetical protein